MTVITLFTLIHKCARERKREVLHVAALSFNVDIFTVRFIVCTYLLHLNSNRKMPGIVRFCGYFSPIFVIYRNLLCVVAKENEREKKNDTHTHKWHIITTTTPTTEKEKRTRKSVVPKRQNTHRDVSERKTAYRLFLNALRSNFHNETLSEPAEIATHSPLDNSSNNVHINFLAKYDVCYSVLRRVDVV